MKALLITAAGLTGAVGIFFFLICPMAICSTPQGYLNWVNYQIRSFAELGK